MSIYIVKDKTKKKLNIPATDVQLLDLEGKFENKNLEDVITKISDTEHLYIGEVDTKKNGFWIDNNEILDSKENNGVVDRLKNYFSNIVGDLKTLTTNSKDTLVNAINENTGSINQLSNPNLLINGDFQVWQRGTSFISTENKIDYRADRWFTMQKGIKVERVTNTSPSMSEFSLRLTTQSTSEQGQSYLVQPIENNSIFEGKTVTLSFWIKGIGKSTILNCRVGNEKNKQSIINLTQEWQFVKITQKANFDTTTKWNSGVIFYTALQNPFSEGDGYEITGIKLELGNKATPFIPRSYGEELALCQRYYQSLNLYKQKYYGVGILNSDGSNTGILRIPLSFQLRQYPTFILKGKLSVILSDGVTIDKLMPDKMGAVICKVGVVLSKELPAGIYPIEGLNEEDDVCLDAEIY